MIELSAFIIKIHILNIMHYTSGRFRHISGMYATENYLPFSCEQVHNSITANFFCTTNKSYCGKLLSIP